jgi:hypothetical protein
MLLVRDLKTVRGCEKIEIQFAFVGLFRLFILMTPSTTEVGVVDGVIKMKILKNIKQKQTNPNFFTASK